VPRLSKEALELEDPMVAAQARAAVWLAGREGDAPGFAAGSTGATERVIRHAWTACLALHGTTVAFPTPAAQRKAHYLLCTGVATE
jgi:hypothetical protein